MNDGSLKRWALLVLGLHLVVATIYSVATPMWEGPDEPSHYLYVQYIANHLQLLPPESDIFEGKQPPLYYAVLGFATFWLQPSETVDIRRNLNRLSRYPEESGYNVAVHGADEAFPYQGLVLGLHVARWLTVLMGTAAVGFTFLTARLIFPGQPILVLAATVIHGFTPTALFLSGIVNNDTLAITFGSAILYSSARLLAHKRPRDMFWPLLALGFGAISKFDALTVSPAAGLAILYAIAHALRTMPKARRRRLVLTLLLGAGVSAVAGWLYLGDLTSRQHAEVPISQILSSFAKFVTNPFGPEFGWFVIPEAFDRGFLTFWARFGWDNLPVGANAYSILSIFCWLAVVGLLMGTVRRYTRVESAHLLLMAVGLLSTLALTTYFAVYSRYVVAFQGRYLMVAVTAASILLAAGFANLFPRRWQSAVLVVVSICFVLWATVIPFQTIAPAYAHAAALPETAVGNVPNPMRALFGDMFELVGYKTEQDSVRPGTNFPVTLYWHSLKATADDYTVAIHVRRLDLNPISVSSLDTFPSHGNFGTSLWTPGTVVVDPHLVRIAPGITQTIGAELVVSMYPRRELPNLAVHVAGLPVRGAATIGRFRILPDVAAPPPSQKSLQYQLGSELALVGYDLASQHDAINLKLYWRALQPPPASYTTFVHVTVDGKLIAQYDGLPLGGALPTDLWRPNDVIVDEITIAIPAPYDGRQAQVWAGMYRTDSLQRLSVIDQQGKPVPDDRIPIPGQ